MKNVQLSDIKNALQDFKDNSVNLESCDYYSWNRKYHHIEDLLNDYGIKKELR